MDKARGADNLVMILERSWHESWVCGEGRVDRAGSTISLRTSLARKCYLSIHHERYLWRVHVGGVSLWDRALGWVVLFSTGHQMFHRAGHRLASCEDIIFGHLRTNMFCGLGLRNPCTPTHFCGRVTDVRLTRIVPLLVGY